MIHCTALHALHCTACTALDCRGPLEGCTVIAYIANDVYWRRIRDVLVPYWCCIDGALTGRLMLHVFYAQVDTTLATVTAMFVRGFIQMLGALLVIGLATPYTLVAFAPVLCLFFWYVLHIEWHAMVTPLL